MLMMAMMIMMAMMTNADDGNHEDDGNDGNNNTKVNLGSKRGVWPNVCQKEGSAERFVLLFDLW